jgi:hypothetical protein
VRELVNRSNARPRDRARRLLEPADLRASRSPPSRPPAGIVSIDDHIRATLRRFGGNDGIQEIADRSESLVRPYGKRRRNGVCKNHLLEVRQRLRGRRSGRPPGVVCPACKNPADQLLQERSTPAYDRACDHARRGEKDAALAALEEALKGGVDLEIVDSDPALGKLRSDPRFAPLVKTYRPK